MGSQAPQAKEKKLLLLGRLHTKKRKTFNKVEMGKNAGRKKRGDALKKQVKKGTPYQQQPSL